MTAFPRHEPPGYTCPFCAVVGGGDNEPFTVQGDVVDRTDATTAWVGSRWWDTTPDERPPSAEKLRRSLGGA